jgi:hypothetical protein
LSELSAISANKGAAIIPPEYAFKPGSSIDTNIVNESSDNGVIPTNEALYRSSA